MFALALLLAVAGLTPPEIAAIERDQARAQAEVEKRYGDRKPGELSPEERRAKAQEEAQAQRRVLEQHGVEPHEWALAQARQTRQQRAEVKEAAQALAEKEQAEAERAAKPGGDPGPVQVQRGISDANPVVLETAEGAPVVVEHGLPAEATSDQELAAEQDRLEGVAPSSEAGKPAPAGKGARPGVRGKR
jgi:hypothetical protein